MGDEEFGESLVDSTMVDDLSADDVVVDDVTVNERDSEVMRSETKLPRHDRACEKRRLLEERLAQRQLEQQIQDYDFELA